MKSVLILVLCVFLFSCREVREVERPKPETNFLAFKEKGSPYVLDESLDLFLTNPWYTYDESNHIIWPNFQIYALKSKGRYYKIQIIDYYRGLLPGHPTIRVEEEGQEPWEMSFEAQGCGNVYTNLDYKECIKDPETNIFTYLNIRDQSTTKMSDQEAREDEAWDVAFNGTEIKINSGESGPGDTRIAPLYLYGSFFDGAVADFQAIAEVSFSDKGERFFQLDFDLKNASYRLPPGVERVVDERYWLKETDESFEAKANNWWILKGDQGFYKFHISSITELSNDSETLSTIKISFYQQRKDEPEFSETLYEWDLPEISSRKRVIRWCLDFSRRNVTDCQEEGWDLRFSALQRRGTRKWRFNVNRGAIGPMSEEEAMGRIFAPQ